MKPASNFVKLLGLVWILHSTTVLAQSTQPNIIWITCEDISPFIRSYGYEGVRTPNIDQLAREGVKYTRAYTTAGVCAPSRSSIITGMYQTSIGTQHMRTAGDPKYQPVPPYSAVIPEYVRCFPEYLRKAGYYCTNNEKQDYQFTPPVTVWDENGPAASHRNRPSGKPFFAVYNFSITHESQLMGRKDLLRVDTAKVIIPPIYPDTETVRHDIARLLTNIELMDEQVGELIAILKQDGVYENSFVFFYSDHGGALPWMKREVLERGTHIPLIIRQPGGKQAGSTNDELVSAVDFAPTLLSLAGVPIPRHLQGQAFLGSRKARTPRPYVFAARDRMDTEYDKVRMVRDKRYRYVYNYMPELPKYQEIEYRLGIPMMRELLALRDKGALPQETMKWFQPKAAEELYDAENDPYEMTNLAGDPKYDTKLKELRRVLQNWTREVGDMSSLSEKKMISKMWGNADKTPLTSPPEFRNVKDGVVITCKTKGASIGYQIHSAKAPATKRHTIQSWDMASIYRPRNGQPTQASEPWTVYSGQVIKLQKGDTLVSNAHRIGFEPAVGKFVR